MNTPPEDAEGLLAAARAGSPEALGRALDEFRNYLLAIATRDLDPALRAKGGASDLVQETLLGACRDFAQFRGSTADEFRAWLRQILHNQVAMFGRRFRDTGRRDVGREVALAADDSAGPGLAAGIETPSAEVSARERDEALRLAVERLPPDYRRVLLLRFQDGRSFEEIGEAMGLTANAARKLWLRAVKRLQTGGGPGPP
jgi:RNA polymerase sigma-70 factor (ECF subfamily)